MSVIVKPRKERPEPEIESKRYKKEKYQDMLDFGDV
jgi:hypothetical protein